AVQDPATVGAFERRQRRKCDCARVLVSETMLREVTPDRSAGQLLHHQEAHTVLLDVVIHGNNVRMIERGQNASFGDEAGPDRRIVAERSRKLFDGDVAVQLAMPTLENDAPTTPTDLIANVIGGEVVGHTVTIEDHAFVSRSPSAHATR